MEIPSIQRHAQRNLEQASVMKQSLEGLRGDLKDAKSQQKIKRVRSVSILIDSALHPGIIDVDRVKQTIQETRAATRAAKDRERRLNALDQKIRMAVSNAHVLIGLAHRARGGHIYAKHQADIMTNH